VKIWSK